MVERDDLQVTVHKPWILMLNINIPMSQNETTEIDIHELEDFDVP